MDSRTKDFLAIAKFALPFGLVIFITALLLLLLLDEGTAEFYVTLLSLGASLLFLILDGMMVGILSRKIRPR